MPKTKLSKYERKQQEYDRLQRLITGQTLEKILCTYHRSEANERKIVQELLNDLSSKYLPSGAGVDRAKQYNYEPHRLARNRIVLQIDYHHMDDVGNYIGISTHDIEIYPLSNQEINYTSQSDNYQALKSSQNQANKEVAKTYTDKAEKNAYQEAAYELLCYQDFKTEVLDNIVTDFIEQIYQ